MQNAKWVFRIHFKCKMINSILNSFRMQNGFFCENKIFTKKYRKTI